MVKRYLGRLLAADVVNNPLALYAALKKLGACFMAKNVFEPSDYDMYVCLGFLGDLIDDDEYMKGWIGAVRRLNLDPLWDEVAKQTLVSALACVAFSEVDFEILRLLACADKQYRGLLSNRLRKTRGDKQIPF